MLSNGLRHFWNLQGYSGKLAGADYYGSSTAKLSLLVMNGLPTAKTGVDPLVRPHFTFKDELSVADDIVYKGQQAVIPSSMRPAMLEKIHRTHFEVGFCIRRAKVSLFWPGMTSVIKKKLISCSLFAQSSPKRTMLIHDIPDSPWS